MSLEKLGRKPLAFAVYGLLVCVGVAIAYFELRGAFPTAVDVVLPLGYVFIVVLMVRRRTLLPDGQSDQQRVGIGIKIPDLAKSLICFIAAILWVGLAGSVTSDTPAGNAVAVGPSLLILGVGAFFFFRGFMRRIR
jgi:hypothetical protein